MIKNFTLQMPKEIRFGAGRRSELPELLSSLGSRVILLGGSHWFAASGWQARFLRMIEPFEVLNLTCPAGEPEVENLNVLLERVRAFQPHALVAVGGGTVLDTAKAVSGLISAQDKVEEYLEGIGKGLSLQAPGIPWIALPTTSGTGAEVTRNAVLKSRAFGAKKSLRSPHLLAHCAIVDPELTVGAPLALSGIVGMDALTQLIEAYVSCKAAPIPRALARQAFPAMLRALKAIPRDPDDLQARTEAAYGAMISGIALANSGLGAAHGFASGLGGMYAIPHGLVCALFIRPVLRANAELIREDCARLLQAAAEEGVLEPSAADEAFTDPVQWLIGEIGELFGLYDLPENLKGFAIDAGQVPEIARRSSGSSMSGNPRELSQQEREAMIGELL